MAFFPTYESRFTKTPNIFFDEILPKAKPNESKLIGYLIRHTLGFNMDAPWTGIKRDDLVEKAGVSYGSITQTVKDCEEKGWILTFIEGKEGDQKKYYFLNDELNEKLVAGLTKGFFNTSTLINLNRHGITQLLKDNDLWDTRTEAEPVQNLNPYKNCTRIKTVPVSCTKIERVARTKFEHEKSQQTQDPQGFTEPLKTKRYKDNNNKDNSKDNNKDFAVAVVSSDDLEIQSHILTLEAVVGEQVSEASIRTWLKHGSVDRVLKCWFKAQEKSGVEDIGAYVTSLLKMGADQETRVASNIEQQNEEPVIMQMWKARQEAAATTEEVEMDTHPIDTMIAEANKEEAHKVWANALYLLEQRVSKTQYDTWFNNPSVHAVDYRANALIVEVPTDFHRDWLVDTFATHIKLAVCAITGQETAVKFVLPPQ